MTRTDRAQQLEQQAAALDRDRSGDWRAKARAREAAARLRRQAWRMRPARRPSEWEPGDPF